MKAGKMIQGLVSKLIWCFRRIARFWIAEEKPKIVDGEKPAVLSQPLQPLRRVLLTDEVGRTLFEEFAEHRQGSRGREETGWILLGLRETDQATVLATLPAGAQRDAGVAHVQFNSNGQILGSRIVRQLDKRLTILGIVHTHPGSLRHPSDGDYEGDRLWVRQLRGEEGIFGIGTADGKKSVALVGEQPMPNMQTWGELCFSWYSLQLGDRRYRPLEVKLVLGPDLARDLHPLWPIIEEYAQPLDRLVRQLAKVLFEVAEFKNGPILVAQVKLAQPAHSLRVELSMTGIRYFLVGPDNVLEVQVPEPRVDRAIYLLLAELAVRHD